MNKWQILVVRFSSQTIGVLAEGDDAIALVQTEKR